MKCTGVFHFSIDSVLNVADSTCIQPQFSPLKTHISEKTKSKDTNYRCWGTVWSHSYMHSFTFENYFFRRHIAIQSCNRSVFLKLSDFTLLSTSSRGRSLIKWIKVKRRPKIWTKTYPSSLENVLESNLWFSILKAKGWPTELSWLTDFPPMGLG